MKKLLSAALILILSVCLMTGCFVVLPKETLKEINGDIKCEFRTGENAKYSDKVIDTDVVFDKDEFVKLYNESNSYDPNHLKYHLDKCDLKINAGEQPDEWKEIFGSEFNIKAVYGDGSRWVSIYRYDSKLYFFVLCMGGKSEPEEIGYYYMELSAEADSYWRPIIE